LRIVLKMPDASVAVLTEQAAHLPGFVVVIDTRTLHLVPADQAAVLLRNDHILVLLE
jgi:hypothetical protein